MPPSNHRDSFFSSMFMISNVDMIRFWSVFVCVVCVVMTSIMPIVYWDYSRVYKMCTARPANEFDSCLAKNGRFGGIHFRAGVHNVQYNKGEEATQVPIIYTHELARDTAIGANTQFVSRVASTCPATFNGAYSQKACNASRIPEMYVTRDSSHTLMLRHGVHIPFFLWFGLYLSTLFLMVWIPTPNSTWGAIKTVGMILWLLVGFLLPLSFALYTEHFDFDLPMGNVFMAWVMQLYVFFLVFTWFKDKKITTNKIEAEEVSATGDVVFTATEPASASTGGISSMMRLSSPGYKLLHTPLNQTTGAIGTRFHKKDYIGAKGENNGLLEILCFEFAVTMPFVVTALYCMAVRDPIDFNVQSIFIRTFLIFAGLGFSDRLFSLDYYCRQDADERSDVEPRNMQAALSLLAFVVLMTGYLVNDIVSPGLDMLHPHMGVKFAYGIIVTTVVFICIFVATMALYQMYLFASTYMSPGKVHDYSMHEWVFIISSISTFTMRVLVIVALWTAVDWNGTFDKLDVPLKSA